MINITYLNPRMLIADEGKILTNGKTYSNVIYLGIKENENNWKEINADEVPVNEEQSEA